ncbi:MAG: RelA/SpoT family protein [Minisyncoccia bacterium]|jgi:GTP pyrophosphokinase
MPASIKTKDSLYKDLKKNLNYLAEEDLVFLDKVYNFAVDSHVNQERKTGEAYICHPLRTALELANLKMDTATIASAILHDTIEDTDVTEDILRKQFGEEIAFLVKGVSKVGGLKYKNVSEEDKMVENFRNMILAMAQDIRVVIIKLADRLDNMKTLWVLPKEKQLRIAKETLDIYASIAYRLGIGVIGAELEDLAFPYVLPQEYRLVQQMIGKKYKEKESFLLKTAPKLKKYLEDNGVKPQQIQFRAKHLFSVWRKLRKEDMDINKVYDLVALRIIVGTTEDCYTTLGLVHHLWRPLPNRFKDYIAIPKPNGYKSIHTTVIAEEGQVIEVQIRTNVMHQEAEYGITAHWFYDEAKKKKAYKKGIKTDFKALSKIAWVSQLQKWQQSFTDSSQFLESIKIDFFSDRIFALTPKGDVIDMPEGATPVDFAYCIHNDVGNSCMGARVNNSMVSLDYKLKSGDVVEILTKRGKKPSSSWLDFVKMTTVRKKIQEEIRKNNDR